VVAQAAPALRTRCRVTDPNPSDAHPRPPPPELLAPGVLVPAFVLTIVVGYALFAHGVGTVAGNELSHPQSLMAAVNAATLTGFQQARNPGDYTLAGQLLTLGLMVAGTWFSLVGGGLAVVRIGRLPYRDRTVALAAVGAVVAAMVLGAVLGAGPGRTPFDGAYQAVSAFGNCGLYTGRLPAGGEPRTASLLLPLAVAGSLGLPVLLDLCTLRPSPHTRRVVVTSALVYLLTVAALVPLLAWKGTLADTIDAFPAAAGVASREAVNARSAGFPFQFVTELPAASAVVLIVAMVVGGAPGGTAGGVKVTAVAAVAAGVRDAALGRPARRGFGVAVGWIAAYLGLLLLATVAVVLADPELPGDRALFLAVSALGNVGLSHDPVSPSTAGRYVLSIAMLLGRVLPVLVLWTVADRMPDVTEAIG
jgi:trk system potassium uptake protein TrkH